MEDVFNWVWSLKTNNCKRSVRKGGVIMITFLLGLLVGSFAGMMLMAIFVAGKKEGTIRDEIL